MNFWLGQFILAARDREGGWMDILIFLVMLFFYGIGVLIKMSKKKAVPKKQDRQIPRKPVQKPAGGPGIRGKQKPWQAERPQLKPEPISPLPVAAKPQVRPASRKVIRPRPAVRSSMKSSQSAGKWKLPAEADGIADLAAFESEPKLEKVPGLTGGAAAATEMPQAEYISDILSDYEDAERLRRAILHYEILGKPVSLRESSEHIGRF